MTPANALKICIAGVSLTCLALVVEFCAFYLHLFVLPVLGMPFTIVGTLLPALIGIGIYQKATKPK